MLFESRTYTFRPGTLKKFWEAQLSRGLDHASRPIMARVIGYFSTINGDQDQVTHLWRFDDFDDWRDRLFFHHPKADPYYKVVRPLMLRQENSFLMPAPIDELNPLWGKGLDWLPGSKPIGDIIANPHIIIEEIKFQLAPGALDLFWKALRENSLIENAHFLQGVFGCFSTLVGQQHEVVIYRWHQSLEEIETYNNELTQQGLWNSFLDEISASILKTHTRLLRPSPLALLSPLFNQLD